jgi:hypothetical protein
MKMSETSKVSDISKERKCDDLRQLQIGDHIVGVLGDQKFCHFIITDLELSSESSAVKVVYFDNGETDLGFDDYLKKASNGEQKVGVKEASLIVSVPASFDVYKVQYEEIEEKCFAGVEVVKKARSFIGMKKYNVFVNNDEHFATYCKTGKAGKLFVLPPEDVKMKTILGGGLSDKLKGNLTHTGANLLIVSTAKHIATKFPRNVAATALPVVAEAAGAVLCVVVEGVSMTFDIHKKYKLNKTGELEAIKFKKYVAKRVTRGTVGVAGGVAGGVVGQMVIPVPVLGALIGGFVGGLLGSAIGHGQGILIGELVEKVDNKVKEKKARKESKDKKPDFEVIDKLVFTLDDLQKKEEESEFFMLNFEKTQSLKVNEANILSANEESEFLQSLKDSIGRKEFDVYMMSSENPRDEGLSNDSTGYDGENFNFIVQIPKDK